MKTLIIIILIYSSIYSQTDWMRWDKVEPNYILDSEHNSKHINKIETSNVLEKTKDIYKFFISDLDGDNCAFHPSCSSFFVEGASKTNVFQGMLMFADRFTRDLNFAKGLNNYSTYPNGKFYDPSIYYLLDSSAIIETKFSKKNK